MSLIKTETTKSYIRTFKWIEKNLDGIRYYEYKFSLYNVNFEFYVDMNPNGRWIYYVETQYTTTFYNKNIPEFETPEEAKEEAFNNFVKNISSFFI